MITRRTLLTAPFAIKTFQAISSSPENLNQAIRILNEAGFYDIETSKEDDRDVITLRSTVAEINTNMEAIVKASKDGILIRCKSEYPEE